MGLESPWAWRPGHRPGPAALGPGLGPRTIEDGGGHSFHPCLTLWHRFVARQDIEKEVLSHKKTQEQLQGRTPKNVIVVPGKIVNIVG